MQHSAYPNGGVRIVRVNQVMKQHFLQVALFLLVAGQAAAQLQWPATTHQTKPWTRWWWQGSAVTNAELSRHLQLYQQAGIGGVEITPIYGVKGAEQEFIDFLSPAWMDRLQHTLQEAQRLDMGVDMATGTGWPFGGPWIQYDHACKQVVPKTWEVAQGESISEKITLLQQPMMRGTHGGKIDLNTVKDPIESNTNLQQLALDQIKFEKPLRLIAVMAYPADGSPAMDLTHLVQPDGTLAWQAPTPCTVYALFMGWHGKMVERAAPGGEGNVIDHFSREAIDTYFARFNAAFAGKNISSLRSFFNDSYEVDDARGQSNWTPAFFEEFEQRRGYNLRQHLPELFAQQGSEKSNRVLYDYRETLSELLLEKFTIPWANWAKEHKAMVRNQSHGSPGNTMDLYAAVDIPETEGEDILRFKFATSAANVTGKPLVSAEAATWLGEHFTSTLADARHSMDRYFIGGVNHIVYHGTSYSPANDPWPGRLFYAAVHFHPNNPFWQQFPALNKYVERVQSFLQAARPNNDVLVYYPYADAQMQRGRDLLKHYDAMRPEFNGTHFQAISEWMLAQGYAFDFISDRQVQAVQCRNGLLLTGGVQYKTILLPANSYIPLATLQHLLQLVRQGAQLLVYKQLPGSVPGLHRYQAQNAELQNLLAALPFEAKGPVQHASLGLGKVLMAQDAGVLLQAGNVRQETLALSGLQYVRKQYKEGHVYFIANHTGQPFAGYLTLQVPHHSAALYNAMTGAMGMATVQNANGTSLDVWLQLAPGESVLMHAADGLRGNAMPRYAAGDTLPVRGTWQVSFVAGGPSLPGPVTTPELTDFTTWPGPDYAIFSGTAAYQIPLAKPRGKADAYYLSLGRVAESADVYLNGSKVATLLGPVFGCTLPARLFRKQNTLRIEVSNSMANRIIHLEKSGVVWKKFYNTNFPARLAANRGEDGLFTPRHWQPRPSGLLGPVHITPLTLVK